MGEPRAEAGKQAYEKPEVRRIKLVRKELAATGCKVLNSAMGPGKGCWRLGVGCRQPGS
jgi:hypothetical protein